MNFDYNELRAARFFYLFRYILGLNPRLGIAKQALHLPYLHTFQASLYFKTIHARFILEISNLATLYYLIIYTLFL